MRTIAERYKRWRHSRGFGIHSPFAYKAVCDLLRDKYAFYGFTDIDNDLEQHPRPRRARGMARLILRLAVFSGARSAFLFQSAPKAFRTALLCADSRMKISSRPAAITDASLIIAKGGTPGIERIANALSAPGKTALLTSLSAEEYATIIDAVSCGLILRAPDSLLIFARRGMGKVEYTINLPSRF